MKLSLLLIIITTLIHCVLFGQTPIPVCEWNKSAGGIYDDEGKAIVADSHGNVYVTGTFRSPEITFGNITLYNSGTNNIFIVKYNSSGNVEWAKSALTNNATSNAIACDALNNIYITGTFFNSSLSLDSITMPNAGGSDIFIAKYDYTGNILWALSEGSNDNDIALSISIDVNANIYISGGFASDTLIIGTDSLFNTGGVDIYLAKFDSSGNALWSKSASGNHFDESYGITNDVFGNSYITGLFQSPSITFEDITLTNPSTPQGDLFIVKYDPAGNVLWAKKANGVHADYGLSLSSDLHGNIYMTGTFISDTLIFDSDTLFCHNGWDIFIFKIGQAGNLFWSKNFGGTHSEGGNCMTTDKLGYIYLTGYFGSEAINFDGVTINNTDTLGYGDIFIAKFDSLGNILWAKNAGGGFNYDVGNCISVDLDNNIYIIGDFKNSPIVCCSDTILNLGGNDIIIEKLSVSVGISNVLNDFSILAFPNPTQCNFSLKVPEETNYIQIINSMGQVIEMRYTNKQTNINFSLKNNGIYIIRVSINNALVTKKIIVISNE